jgi:hypothetical protein
VYAQCATDGSKDSNWAVECSRGAKNAICKNGENDGFGMHCVRRVARVSFIFLFFGGVEVGVGGEKTDPLTLAETAL